MLLGSHNSWTYLSPRKWWMRLFSFTAKCQNSTIHEQYEKYGVRCFDLRVRFDNQGKMIVSHGLVEYNISEETLMSNIEWLNSKGDVVIRILHESRKKNQYNEFTRNQFIWFCKSLEKRFQNIKFWCGRNLYNWKIDYEFKYEPSCEEKYASVRRPRILDDWYPKLYAWFMNKKNREIATDKDILLIDFVNIR